MSNQNFENNGMNGTRPLGKGSSPERCFLVQQRKLCHRQVIARMKWNKEVNKTVMECFYRGKRLIKKGNLSEDTHKEFLENGQQIEVCLNQQSNVYVTKQGQLGKMDGYHHLNWKQLQDSYKMNFWVNLVKMLQRKLKQ